MSLRCRIALARGDFSLDVEFHWEARGVCAVFGRSGCGKTTLLRSIAGLEKNLRADVQFHDLHWHNAHHQVPTHRREIGFVFQEPTLFPHLDVTGNLRFGQRRVPPDRQRIGFDEAVRLLGLGALLRRNVQSLSGGQRQRVAIGRALLTSPRLLLLDEPLASLDLESRAEILPYLENLRDQLGIPMLYVSHSPAEVARLADHLILLENGRVRASGPLNAVLTDPRLPLAHLDEASAVLDASLAAHDERYHLSTVDVPGGQMTVAYHPLPLGSRTRVRILARDVSLTLYKPEHTSISNCLPASITDLTADPDPARVVVGLEVGGARILAKLTRRSVDLLGLAVGTPVYAQIKAVALMG